MDTEIYKALYERTIRGDVLSDEEVDDVHGLALEFLGRPLKYGSDNRVLIFSIVHNVLKTHPDSILNLSPKGELSSAIVKNLKDFFDRPFEKHILQKCLVQCVILSSKYPLLLNLVDIFDVVAYEETDEEALLEVLVKCMSKISCAEVKQCCAELLREYFRELLRKINNVQRPKTRHFELVHWTFLKLLSKFLKHEVVTQSKVKEQENTASDDAHKGNPASNDTKSAAAEVPDDRNTDDDDEPFPYVELWKYLLAMACDSNLPFCAYQSLHVMARSIPYGDYLIKMKVLPPFQLFMATKVTQNISNILRNLPILPVTKFCDTIQPSQCPSDSVIRKAAILTLRAVVVQLKYVQNTDKQQMAECVRLMADGLTKLNPAWLKEVLAEQDDVLLEVMLCILHACIQLRKESDSLDDRLDLPHWFHPHRSFVLLLNISGWDHSVLLDWLTASETCCSLYFHHYLRYLVINWQEFCQVCEEDMKPKTQESPSTSQKTVKKPNNGQGATRLRIHLTNSDDSESNDSSNDGDCDLSSPPQKYAKLERSPDDVNESYDGDNEQTDRVSDPDDNESEFSDGVEDNEEEDIAEEEQEKKDLAVLAKLKEEGIVNRHRESVLDKVMTLLIQLRLGIEKLVDKNLFPYSAASLLKTLKLCESLYEI